MRYYFLRLSFHTSDDYGINQSIKVEQMEEFISIVQCVVIISNLLILTCVPTCVRVFINANLSLSAY